MVRPKLGNNSGGGAPNPPVTLPPVVVTANRPRDPFQGVNIPHQGSRLPGPVPGMGSNPTVRMSAYERGAYKYVSPGGHRYSLQMRVSAAQESIISQIVDYGFSRGAPEETIALIATIAYKESSFGDKLQNPASNARGLFQYMPASWKERHEKLNRDSNPDQITAMYDDIDYFRARYTEHLSQDKIAGTMTFPEYAYACHYRGPYKPQKFDGDPEVKQVVSDFRDKWLVLSLHVQ